jgi:bifunctional DNA primase/polymerase-like protein
MSGAASPGAGEIALQYAARGFCVFPCNPRTKGPLTENGFYDATTNAEQIREWWARWPDALIGFWPGPSDLAVLDVDVKHGKDGIGNFIRLDGCPILPPVPTVRTPSDGYHFHFLMPEKTTVTTTVCDPADGLDWRGEGGYVILPSPGSGYRWEHWNYDNCKPKLPGPGLLPKEVPPRTQSAKPVRPASGLSPYGTAALNDACRTIVAAPAGQQETTLHREAFSIGTLAGAGAIPADFARRVLIHTAYRIRDHDPLRPWRSRELEKKINRSCDEGLRHPREVRDAR